MATYSSILARKIPRIEESGGLQSMVGGGAGGAWSGTSIHLWHVTKSEKNQDTWLS